jgi:hypothetical protein
MKRAATLFAAVLAVYATGALAQSTDATTPDATKATRPTAKESMDAQMNLQKNKPSKTPTTAEKSSPKYRPGGKEGMDAQMNLQKNKPSKAVDKNAKAQAPMKDVREMTPEEKAQVRKDVVKDAKP